jgi:hypothetical protein
MDFCISLSILDIKPFVSSVKELEVFREPLGIRITARDERFLPGALNPNSAIEKSWCIVGCKKLSGSEGIG